MKRVAIDFGNTGIRKASFDTIGAGLDLEGVDGEPSLATLGEALKPHCGLTGVEVTLRCTHAGFQDHSPGFWNDWASKAGCRWFRVLGRAAEECPTLGIARSLASELHVEGLAVIDAGASQTSIAVAGHHGRPLAFDNWRPDGNLSGVVDRATEVIASAIDQADGALVVTGIGGQGPEIARRLADRIEGVSLHELASADRFPTIGILHANIVRRFETRLPSHPGPAELRDAFLTLMDQSYDAITREGYDLDDAECVRQIVMRTTDNARRGTIECGMNLDPLQIARAFVRQTWNCDSAPAGVNVEMFEARVIATIEPVKPAVSRLVISD